MLNLSSLGWARTPRVKFCSDYRQLREAVQAQASPSRTQ
jgi:hypothetical protein